MRRAMETIVAKAIAPGGTETDMTALVGSNFTVRDSKAVQLVGIWNVRQQNGSFRIVSPLIHDAVVGISQKVGVPLVQVTDQPVPQPVTPQDTLVLKATGSSVAADVEHSSYTLLYEELAGIDANLITAAELRRRALDIYCPSNVLVVPATTGEYSPSVAINATDDQLKANQDYAIVGMTQNQSNNVSVIQYTSPDWGNLRVGIPYMSAQSSHVGADWFFRLSELTGLPTIPVMNASNKESLLLQAAGPEGGGNAGITTQMVRLRPK